MFFSCSLVTVLWLTWCSNAASNGSTHWFGTHLLDLISWIMASYEWLWNLNVIPKSIYTLSTTVLIQNQYSVRHILIGLCLLMLTLLLVSYFFLLFQHTLKCAVWNSLTLCLHIKLSSRWSRTCSCKWQFHVGYANDPVSHERAPPH